MTLTEIHDAHHAGTLRWRPAVYAVVQAIPEGKVLGYGHVAALLGKPRAARQVGYALAALGEGGVDPEGRRVPWWRVLRSDGTIAMQGDVSRGPTQMAHLTREGVDCSGQRVDMAAVRWRPEV